MAEASEVSSMHRGAAALALFLTLTGGALAQRNELAQSFDETVTPQQQIPPRTTPDLPIGYPYNVGTAQNAAGNAAAASSSVTVRDYLSSRVDQLRIELINRIELLERQQRVVMDERDRQYAQRFEAQQQALTAALQAAKEAVANALSAAKEAVSKAEDASNKRFDSVNEFREQLRDQSSTFISKDAATASFKSIDEKLASIVLDVNRNSSRLDSLQAVREDNKDSTGYWIAAVGILIGAGGLVLALRKQQGARA